MIIIVKHLTREDSFKYCSLYENTKEYELQSHIKWTRWFRPVAFCYEKMSKRVGQIHLGMGGKWETMHGSIIGVIDEKDGRENVRVG